MKCNPSVFVLSVGRRLAVESLPFLFLLWSAPARPTVDRSTWRALVDRSIGIDPLLDTPLESLNILLSQSRSLEVIENRTIRKLGYGFLFAYHSNYMALSCIISEINRYFDRKTKQTDRHLSTA